MPPCATGHGCQVRAHDPLSCASARPVQPPATVRQVRAHDGHLDRRDRRRLRLEDVGGADDDPDAHRLPDVDLYRHAVDRLHREGLLLRPLSPPGRRVARVARDARLQAARRRVDAAAPAALWRGAMGGRRPAGAHRRGERADVPRQPERLHDGDGVGVQGPAEGRRLAQLRRRRRRRRVQLQRLVGLLSAVRDLGAGGWFTPSSLPAFRCLCPSL